MISAKSGAYIWNTINSMLNAGMSAVLLLVVSRICGEDQAGNFTLAFSVAQLMVTIGYFELRSYQVTDINNKYSNEQYYSFKVLSCLTMLVVSVIYVFSKGYSFDRIILILLLCVLKMLDAYEEYYITLYQKENQLDVGAKYSSIRLLATILAFLVLIIITQNMYIASVGAITAAVIIIWIWFEINAKRNFSVSLSGDIKSIMGILWECMPLFIGSYLTLYVGNAPKYAIDDFLELKYQTYYGILYMPSFVINLLSGFVFKPLLVDLSAYYYNNRKRYRKIVLKIFGILACIFLLVMISGYFLGIPLLNLLYGVNLDGYRTDLLIIILGGAVSALGIIICYMITIMRRQKWLTISYLVTAIAAGFLSPILVKNYEIRGASIGFLLYNIIRVLLFAVILFICSKKENKTYT
ncbi:MAG: hypothetical protein HFH65_03125 [Lachnospiraceae bacterium]|nr:hypothetical protein [Lachnospiraceae bacterium]